VHAFQTLDHPDHELCHTTAGNSTWPWLQSFHIDRRGRPSPGERDIVGDVHIFTSTPDAVCTTAIAPGAPQVNVSLNVQCDKGFRIPLL
jgi:hypothetical protein